MTIECLFCFSSDLHNICPTSLHVPSQVIFQCVNIITCFTFEYILLVRSLVPLQCTFQQFFITNVKVYMCMTSSDVVLQLELCIECPLTYVAKRLLFLVVLSEVPLETNFITKNFATILAGSFLTHVHAPQLCDGLKNFHF